MGCEKEVQARSQEALVIRPELIIDPGDPSGRFTYWPERLAEGSDVLRRTRLTATAKVIDVRDLAGWNVTGAEQRLTGVNDASGRSRGWVTCVEEMTNH